MAKLTIALLVGCASALKISREHIVAMPMHRFADECGKKSTLRTAPGAASFLQNVPGAGLDAFEPFGTVLKDGYMLVSCVKDYMYYYGDKFGDNKYDYKLGSVSNVSIVHYDAFVATEDQSPMTPNICFEACRTVPNMGFFGIVNGRGCYCTPYYKTMESDSSMCDAVCDGDNSQMCGGKSKSSIFAMHTCDSTASDLSTSTGKALDLKSSMDAAAQSATEFATGVQTMAEKLQTSFGKVGDTAASGLAQECKVFAGKVEAATKSVTTVSSELDSLAAALGSDSDFADPATVTKAERTMENIDGKVAEGEAAMDMLEKLIDPVVHEPVNGSAEQYYPVMYFVDKEFKDVPSTCAGDVITPVVGSLDACATACDSFVDSCVGFTQVEMDGMSGCMLFSNFKTGFYYTGCDTSFLQARKREAPFSAMCYAKFHKFNGMTLKPDPSGKCEQCFEKLTKADRCY